VNSGQFGFIKVTVCTPHSSGSHAAMSETQGLAAWNAAAIRLCVRTQSPPQDFSRLVNTSLTTGTAVNTLGQPV
jgi:hypothetical protein